MFDACLSLPRDPREAALIADQLDAVARALRDGRDRTRQATSSSDDRVTTDDRATDPGSRLFERLMARVAPLAARPREREAAIASAEATAAVLRCLWPELQQPRPIALGAPLELTRR